MIVSLRPLLRAAARTCVAAAGWGILAAQPAAGLEAPVAPGPVALDGVLREWGAAGTVAMDPGGREIGVRGTFDAVDDFLADVYVMWDARYLYIAAAVRDDSLDTGRVPPSGREYVSARGPVDRMFYYDHFKVFVRGPGADVGTNLWVAPIADAGHAYAWGGRQRQGPGQEMPLLAASAARYPVYTYEVALPWRWLDIYPEPGMALDALALLTDSDRPGEGMAAKVAAGDDSWIWWQGRLVLQGQPPGWEPAPSVEEQVEARLDERRESAATAEGIGKDENRRIRAAIERARAARQVEARAESTAAAGSRPAPAEAATVGDDRAAGRKPRTGAEPAAPTPVDTAARAATRRYAAAMRAVLSRSAAAPVSMDLPEWVYGANADSIVTRTQVDSLTVILTRTLGRLVRGRTSGRIDYFAVDLASGARTSRHQARSFLTALLEKYLDQLEDETSAETLRLARAAAAAGIGGEAARQLARDVVRRSLDAYAAGKATTTNDLIRQGRRRAGLTRAQAAALLDTLFGP